MRLFDPRNALEESWLLFLLNGILGLRIIRARNRRWMFATHVYPFLVIGSYHVFFFATKETTWRHCDSFFEVISYLKYQKLRSCAELLTVSIVAINGLLRSFEDLDTCDKIDSVDKLLRYLNVTTDREASMRNEAACIFVHVSFYVVANIFTYLSIVTADCGAAFNAVWICNKFPGLVEVLTISSFVILMNKTRERYVMVNLAIGEALFRPAKISIILARPRSSDKVSRLRLARRVHLKLTETAAGLNESYEFRLIFISVVNIVYVITDLMNAVLLIGNENGGIDIFTYAVRIAFRLGEIFYLANACRAAMAEAQRASGFFLNASLTQGPTGFDEEVKIFYDQLTDNKLRLKLIGFSPVDLTKSLTILIAIITYLSLVSWTSPPAETQP